MTYIAPEIVDKIKEAAIMEDVIADYVDLRKSGANLVGTCPCCNAKKKFNVSVSKQIWKCFVCDESGKDAISFLTLTQGFKYPQALNVLAQKYTIETKEDKPVKAKKKARKSSFRDAQLRESGLRIKDLRYFLDEKGGQVQYDRFQKGTIDKTWNITNGDDMIIHYLGLNGKPITYDQGKGKRRSLIRLRWANPNLHKDKYGNPMKYSSPYGSGSHLYIPNAVIAAYKGGVEITTLIICEGEKKAEKLCKEGIYAVAVMGIHNFALKGDMPYDFQQIIKRCATQNVIFLLDADWQDLSLKEGKSVDQRPKTFYSAVEKFQTYFKAYARDGMPLELFLAYGKSLVYKGIDDVLVRQLKGKESELEKDIKNTMESRESEGIYVNIHKITQLNSWKLKEFWHLHSRVKFFNHHAEQLQKLNEFKWGRIRWRYNAEDEAFELAQKIMPSEQFWSKFQKGETKYGDPIYQYKFSYVRMIEFLRNRGFGLYEHQKDQFRIVHIDGRVIEETSHQAIQRYVEDFTREIDEIEVLEMIIRGKKQYLGPEKLSSMHYWRPEFCTSGSDEKFLFFKNCYWRITSEEIIQRPLSELPKHVWKDQLIDFEPTYTGKPMCSFERDGEKWKIDITDEMKASQIAQFYAATSNFHWKKSVKLETDGNGKRVWIERDPEEVEPTDQDDIQIWRDALIDKMICAGYVMHDYKDWGNMRAIVCMDGLESEIGKSEGGTGKSIWAKQFKWMAPTEIIDGKKRNIEDDNHIYQDVDERTAIILFDDVRPNFNFKWLFSQITTGITANPKGTKQNKYDPPKFIITTNHALPANDSSSRRRQKVISFSDYFNEYRTPGTEYGGQMFYEWEHDQWNLYYNWMATCIQTYLQHGLQQESASDASLEKRKIRQLIGENFVDWASLVYANKGILLNTKVEKKYLLELYLRDFSEDRKWVSTRKLKAKLQLYAKYADLDYNITEQGGRIRANGMEYFIISDNTFRANDVRTINNDIDFKTLQNPFS